NGRLVDRGVTDFSVFEQCVVTQIENRKGAPGPMAEGAIGVQIRACLLLYRGACRRTAGLPGVGGDESGLIRLGGRCFEQAECGEVVDLIFVAHRSVHLRGLWSERRASGLVVALHAVLLTRVGPGDAARAGVERHGRAIGDDLGVGLLLVPLVAVANPVVGIEVHEQACLDQLGIEAEGLEQHRAYREVPATVIGRAHRAIAGGRRTIAHVDLGARRQHEGARLVGGVGPERAVDFVSDCARDELAWISRIDAARLTEGFDRRKDVLWWCAAADGRATAAAARGRSATAPHWATAAACNAAATARTRAARAGRTTAAHIAASGRTSNPPLDRVRFRRATTCNK